MPRLELHKSLHAPENWGYPERLRRAGHRVTPQREQLLELLYHSGKRQSALELCAQVRGMNPATVYRNLAFLVQVGLVHAVEIQGELYYELNNPNAPHHHLVCRRCGREQEVSAHVAAAFLSQLERTYGFQAEPNHWVIYGRCEACHDPSE
ncbi:MAG: transcriptional repressor [Meiothermus sp.]|nr:transcriptional repressor [Meiothermus sp.]